MKKKGNNFITSRKNTSTTLYKNGKKQFKYKTLVPLTKTEELKLDEIVNKFQKALGRTV